MTNTHFSTLPGSRQDSQISVTYFEVPTHPSEFFCLLARTSSVNGSGEGARAPNAPPAYGLVSTLPQRFTTIGDQRRVDRRVTDMWTDRRKWAFPSVHVLCIRYFIYYKESKVHSNNRCCVGKLPDLGIPGTYKHGNDTFGMHVRRWRHWCRMMLKYVGTSSFRNITYADSTPVGHGLSYSS